MLPMLLSHLHSLLLLLGVSSVVVLASEMISLKFASDHLGGFTTSEGKRPSMDFHTNLREIVYLNWKYFLTLQMIMELAIKLNRKLKEKKKKVIAFQSSSTSHNLPRASPFPISWHLPDNISRTTTQYLANPYLSSGPGSRIAHPKGVTRPDWMNGKKHQCMREFAAPFHFTVLPHSLTQMRNVMYLVITAEKLWEKNPSHTVN